MEKVLSEDAKRTIRVYAEQGVTVQDAMAMVGLGIVEKARVLMELRQAGYLTGDTAATLKICGQIEGLGAADSHDTLDGLMSSARFYNDEDEEKKRKKIKDEIDGLDLTSLSITSPVFSSPVLSYRSTGAKATEHEPDPEWFEPETIKARDRHSYFALSEFYQAYADYIRDDFLEVDLMDTTGLGIPRQPGQVRRNKQKELLRHAWAVFFWCYQPLSNQYAKALLDACDNNAEPLLDWMALVATRLHLTGNISEKGTPVRHPFAYMMELMEKAKKGAPDADDPILC